MTDEKGRRRGGGRVLILAERKAMGGRGRVAEDGRLR